MVRSIRRPSSTFSRTRRASILAALLRSHGGRRHARVSQAQLGRSQNFSSGGRISLGPRPRRGKGVDVLTRAQTSLHPSDPAEGYQIRPLERAVRVRQLHGDPTPRRLVRLSSKRVAREAGNLRVLLPRWRRFFPDWRAVQNICHGSMTKRGFTEPWKFPTFEMLSRFGVREWLACLIFIHFGQSTIGEQANASIWCDEVSRQQ